MANINDEEEEKNRICPARKECLDRTNAPMGMYHCPYCGEMILAGIDPLMFCLKWEEKDIVVEGKMI